MTNDDIFNLYKIIFAMDEDFHFFLNDILDNEYDYNLGIFYYVDFEKKQ